MNVHISPEKIQEYNAVRDAQDDAWGQAGAVGRGGVVFGANQVLERPTYDQVTDAENAMQHDFDTRVEAASHEAEFLAYTDQGKLITYYLEGISDYDEAASPIKEGVQEDPFNTLTETKVGPAENNKRSALISFAQAVKRGDFGDASLGRKQWRLDSQARLQEMASSLAKNPRYPFGETVNVERRAKDGHDSYVENNWKVAGPSVSGYMFVEKADQSAYKEVPIQDLDAWNGFNPADDPDQGVA